MATEPDERSEEVMAMAKDRASRASMDHHGLRSQGGTTDAKRMVNIAEERDRKTAGQKAIDYYAEKNPAINPLVTHLNLDMVNDGQGGFREMRTIDEGLDYAHGRLKRCTKEIKAGERDDAARTRDLREGTGERFLDTIVGHLPGTMCEPDGTQYQPIDPETGKGRVYKRGSKKGQAVMLDRYRAKDMGEAIRYFEHFVAFQAARLPGGQAAIHGYSIQFDEGRPHIQIQADFLMDDISRRNPQGLKSGYQLAFGSHRKVKAPKLDAGGNVVLGADGAPVMVQESGSRKMARYHTELREHMLALGYDIEAEIDHARAGRRVDHDDYKELVAAQDEHDDLVAEDLELIAVSRAEADRQLDEIAMLGGEAQRLAADTEDRAIAVHESASEAGYVDGLSRGEATVAARTAELDQRAAGLAEREGELDQRASEIAATTRQQVLDAMETTALKAKADADRIRTDAATEAGRIVDGAQTEAEEIKSRARTEAKNAADAALADYKADRKKEIDDGLATYEAEQRAAIEVDPAEVVAAHRDRMRAAVVDEIDRMRVQDVEVVDGTMRKAIDANGKPVLTDPFSRAKRVVAHRESRVDMTNPHTATAMTESFGERRAAAASSGRKHGAAYSEAAEKTAAHEAGKKKANYFGGDD